MQRFIQGPRLSRFIAPFLSLEDEVGRLFKLMRMGGGGGGRGRGGGFQARVSQIKWDPSFIFFSAIFFSANWVDG